MPVRDGRVNTDKFTIIPYEYTFAGEDGYGQVCLPMAYIRLLQSQSGRNLWYSTFRDEEGERVDLSHEERQTLLEGVHSLLFGVTDCDQTPAPPPPVNEEDCIDEKIIIDQLRKLLKRRCITMCNCCGCNSGYGDCPPPVPIEGEQDVPIVPNVPGDNDQDAVWCRRASWLVSAWVGFIGAVQGGAVAGIELSGTWLTGLISIRLGEIGIWIAGIVATIIGYLTSSTTWNGMYQAVSDTDTILDLVCAIYSAPTPLQAKENFKEVISGVNATWYQKMMLHLWRQVINWSLVFDESTWDALEARFPQILTQPLNCQCDGTTPPVPPTDDSEPLELESDNQWYLVPMMVREPIVGDGGTLTEEGFLHQFDVAVSDGSAVGAKYYLQSPFLTDADMSGTYGQPNRHAGYVVERVVTSGNIKLGAFADSGIMPITESDFSAFDVFYRWHAGSDLALADLESSLPAIFEAPLVIASQGDSPYANLSNSRVRIAKTGTQNNGWASYRIWAIMHSSTLA